MALVLLAAPASSRRTARSKISRKTAAAPTGTEQAIAARWLAVMPLRDRIAQLIVIPFNGRPMNTRGNNAASRTLLLGTVARITNLETHKSAVVVIQDRGPYVRGRIVDLSPSTARKIGITRKQGIAKVAVTPLAIPLKSTHIKLTVLADNSETEALDR